eukprot:TRINITY_DN80199_c0_g1_i1.p1 TRINITY_DN80199_c0_g1~~TRINITY_DN80199_c0_g1_i1.p1  ORF type:complete len:180 (+),score=49.35 TRINITY_DN80199_c0_g1_i1:48-587(+)
MSGRSFSTRVQVRDGMGGRMGRGRGRGRGGLKSGSVGGVSGGRGSGGGGGRGRSGFGRGRGRRGLELEEGQEQRIVRKIVVIEEKGRPLPSKEALLGATTSSTSKTLSERFAEIHERKRASKLQASAGTDRRVLRNAEKRSNVRSKRLQEKRETKTKGEDAKDSMQMEKKKRTWKVKRQ